MARILNLYAGIGGNRKLWSNEHQITAVEYDAKIAAIYKDLYPNDEVVVGDAHEYLLSHHNEYDFIWSSPPCQSHSSFRYNINVRFRGTQPKYPDMTLYEEILFLQYHSSAKWVVENVVPYYEPFLEPRKINRHLYWANFELPQLPELKEKLRTAQIAELEQLHDVNLKQYKLPNKRQVLRNCVHYEVGNEILKAALNG